jgi:hypothetical protein
MGQWDSGDDWLRRARRACPDDVLRDIINDNRGDFPRSGSMIPNQQPSKVVPVGAGKVTTPGELAQGTGWVKPPSVDQWKPDGLSIMDEMMDQQDRIDRAARIRELAGTQHSQRLAEAAREAEAKAQEPKAPKDRGDKK